jgi:hypothetical protein
MTRRWLENITDAIERATDHTETTANKLARLGWTTDDGSELSWRWHQQNAKWPIQEGHRIKYYTTATARTLR